MSLVHQIFFDATTAIREDAEPKTVSPTGSGCACCGRGWAEVEAPDRAYPYSYDSSTGTEEYCLTCATPRLSAPTVLGIESYRGGGKSGVKKPVGGKLGMLMGSGGVITANGELHLALPPGYIEKFKDGSLGRAGRLHQVPKSLDLLMLLHRNGELGDVSRGIVYVEHWGRKADVLMGSLRVTTDLRELWCNSDSGTFCRNLDCLLRVAEVIDRHGHRKAAKKPAFWRPIHSAASGKHDADALKRWADETAGAAEIIDALPVDPHDRQGLHLSMQKILGES